MPDYDISKRDDDMALADVIDYQRRLYDVNPIPASLWNAKNEIIDCNEAMVKMFGLSGKKEVLRRFFEFSPAIQPCGTPSAEKVLSALREALERGMSKTRWIHEIPETGEIIPGEVTAVRVDTKDSCLLAAYFHDMREIEALAKKEREASLRQQLIYNSNPIPAAIWSADYRPIDCNEAMVKMLGLTSKDEYISRFFEFVPIRQPCGSSSHEKILAQGKTIIEKGYSRFSWEHITARDELIPGEVTAVRIDLDNEKVCALYMHDLRPLIEIEEQTQLILDTTPLAITLFGRNLKPVDCNAEAVKMFGAGSKREYIEKFNSFMVPQQAGGQKSENCLSGFIVRALKEGYAHLPEFICKRADGSPLIIETTYIRIRHKDDYVVMEYARDITEMKKTLEKAREQEAYELVTMLLEASPVLIEMWDNNLDLIDCNKQFLRLFGLTSKAEFIINYESLSPEEQPCGTLSREKSEALKKQALLEGYSHSEWMYLTANGQELPVEVIYTRITHKNRYIIVGYNHDLREIKAAMAEIQRIEIAEESNKAKSRFLARMSHEIRTPITAVLGIAEIQMQDPKLSPLVEESFAKIYGSANLLLRIINDILDLSKIEAGKLTIFEEEYEAASMINDISLLHQSLSGDKSIQFRLNVDEKIPRLMFGDVLRVEQVVTNLLSNAFKYTEEGSIELSLGVAPHSEHDYVNLIISIKDTGLGMTKEQLDLLLNSEYVRFHEHENNRLISGTGLGMAIVLYLLQLMNGVLELESEVGVGTSVVVRIPQKVSGHDVLGKESARRLRQFDESASAALKRHKFAPEPMPYGKVLVVDDVEANLYVARGLLAFYGLKIETCGDGHEAIEKVKQGKVYDIIFMDHMMPGINGTETMRKMRELGYSEPIVVLTANALIGKAEEFIENGFDGFISKPIQTRHLNAVLTKHIRDKQPPEMLERAKYFTRPSSNFDDYQNDAALVEILRADFAKRHKKTFLEIAEAINAGELKTAHIMAHTLKGVAGLIHETPLAQAAGQVELLLAEGKLPKDELSSLENELAKVLKNIGTVNAPAFQTDAIINIDLVRERLDRLAPLLKSRNAECLSLLEELRAIPEAAIFVRQVENYDFSDAQKSLKILREILE